MEGHRSLWAAQFTMLEGLIRQTIPDQVIQIHHIGSTAVPGLVAKPVIDSDLIEALSILLMGSQPCGKQIVTTQEM
ncbi:GrpB family protein [Arthrobacter sp. UYP6]|uniref:GrpB family protein n=1 Tax=Arthrobacter sp. UYP6 TaxID=1756378 RepID=UPI00339697F3